MGIARDESLFDVLERQSLDLVTSGFDEPVAAGRELLQRRSGPCSTSSPPIRTRIRLRTLGFSGHSFSRLSKGHSASISTTGEAVAIEWPLSDHRVIAGVDRPRRLGAHPRRLRTPPAGFLAQARRSAWPRRADGSMPPRGGSMTQYCRPDRPAVFSRTPARCRTPCSSIRWACYTRARWRIHEDQVRGCAFERVRAMGRARDLLLRAWFAQKGIDPVHRSLGAHSGRTSSSHARGGHEELYVVVSGKGLMTLDGEEFEVGPGMSSSTARAERMA